MAHTVTKEDLFEGNGQEVTKILASSFGGGYDKRLLLLAHFAGFHEGRIIGARVEFRVESHNVVVLETDSVDSAIEAYNTTR